MTGRDGRRTTGKGERRGHIFALRNEGNAWRKAGIACEAETEGKGRRVREEVALYVYGGSIEMCIRTRVKKR